MTTKPRVTVDAPALQANWRLLKSKTAGDCAAVVKANGYGLGIENVAPPLWQAGCRTFYVAHTLEGVGLRKLLPEARIIILHGAHQPELLKAHNLIPCLNGPQDLHWQDAAWLHVDTGMNRLGFAPSDVPENLKPSGIMSHLACSDEHHPMNEQQLKAFREVRKKFADVPASFANSSGVFLGPAYHFDLLRPGVALYGVNPTPDQPNPMQPVVSVHVPVLQTRDVPEGVTVGYSATFMTARPSKLATIECGYADGLLRSLSVHGFAAVNGVRVPFAGRVSMDMIVLDVTDAPPVKAGDMVELIGAHISVDDVAQAAGTIGYEVLTNLKLRD
jgi:alanine racemase